MGKIISQATVEAWRARLLGTKVTKEPADPMDALLAKMRDALDALDALAAEEKHLMEHGVKSATVDLPRYLREQHRLAQLRRVGHDLSRAVVNAARLGEAPAAPDAPDAPDAEQAGNDK